MAALPGASGQGFSDLTKAVWVWSTTPDDWYAIQAFCREQRIGEIMLSLSQDTRAALISGDAATLQKLDALRSGGLSVRALAGEQDWITRKATSLPRSLADVLEIARRHSAFDGLHLDVEPQLLPQWRSGDRSGVGQTYLALLSRIRKATSGMQLEVTAHPNYAEVQIDGQSLLARVIQTVDRVSLMAYRDEPAAAVSYARSAIAAFREARSSWHFGVLVNASKESSVSYYGTSDDDFQREMVTLDQSLRAEGTNGYLGLIFEDYRGLSKILAA